MLLGIRERLRRKEEGFTLIELMVVVLIIAILIAIAIPTFLGARKRAQDKQAQSNLRNALTAEKTWYTDNQAYTTTVANLQTIETALDFTKVDASQRGVTPNALVSTVTPATTDQGICLESDSKSGTKFYLVDITTGAKAGTYYGKDTSCPADDSTLPGTWTLAGW